MEHMRIRTGEAVGKIAVGPMLYQRTSLGWQTLIYFGIVQLR